MSPKVPNSRRNLDLAIERVFDDRETALRMRRVMANVIVGQLLPDGVVKGGSAMKIRFGFAVTRVSSDLDTARAKDIEAFISELESALIDGWNGFTGHIVPLPPAKPKNVPPEYVMQPFDIKLSYNEKPWITVPLEVGSDEIGDADEPEYFISDDIVEIFRKLGFPDPKPIPLMPLHHQIAQKLHGASEEGSARAHDLIDLQVIVNHGEIDWEKTRETCIRLFNYRRKQTWPPVVSKGEDWESLSERLTSEYGRGWSTHHLRQCMRLATVFPDEEILYAVRTKLNWTCIRTVMYIDEPLKRDFYIEMCKLNGWSSRTLQGRIKSMLYERTAIAKKPDEVIANDLEQLREEGGLSQDLVFRDPYFLDYLGLHGDYSERDLESAIVAELQYFITELGNDFAFLDRQKRITIDGRDYYIDLLFFHRRLRRLVAIELKLGEFEASFKGQMELYLRWLEKYEMVEGENQPIGLILCSGKNDEHVELLGLDEGNIRVAEYITQLPPMEVLEEKLRLAISRARRRLEG